MANKFRSFLLVRKEDVSGVSGTGVVAEGVQFSDGTTVIHWLGEWPSTTVHERGIESVQHIHGHDGKTVIMWELQTSGFGGGKSE